MTPSYMWNLKEMIQRTYLQDRDPQTLENDLMVARGDSYGVWD